MISCIFGPKGQVLSASLVSKFCSTAGGPTEPCLTYASRLTDVPEADISSCSSWFCRGRGKPLEYIVLVPEGDKDRRLRCCLCGLYQCQLDSWFADCARVIIFFTCSTDSSLCRTDILCIIAQGHIEPCVFFVRMPALRNHIALAPYSIKRCTVCRGEAHLWAWNQHMWVSKDENPGCEAARCFLGWEMLTCFFS